MKHGDFVATEVLKFTDEEIQNMLEQLKKIYTDNTEITYINVYDDEYYKNTGCKYWYSISSYAEFKIKISSVPLIYKARNGKKIKDFDTIRLTAHKKRGRTQTEKDIISYNFSFRNNGTMGRGNIFEINPHYFYDDDLNALTYIVNQYHKALVDYLPDENTQLYTRKEFANLVRKSNKSQI